MIRASSCAALSPRHRPLVSWGFVVGRDSGRMRCRWAASAATAPQQEGRRRFAANMIQRGPPGTVAQRRLGAVRSFPSSSVRGCRNLSTGGAAASSSTSKGGDNSTSLSLWYPVLGGLLVTTLGGIKYFHDHLGGSEGLVRAVSFYKVAIPRYLIYRYHAWRGSDPDAWDKLDHETSRMGLDIILELEGFYIKCGQLCASNFGDAFPKVWQDTMSVLQDQVPPQPFGVIKSVIEQELDFDLTFATFDPVPIGAASIGQVHRATLNDGRHTPVVVKVCYPDVERLLKGDVRTIKLFAQVAQPVHVPALEETEKQFQTEFDYRREAQNLETVRNNLTRAGLAGPGKLCQVPKPFLELCTKRVLVMEELDGPKLQVELARDLQRHAERAGMSVPEFLEVQRQRHWQPHEAERPSGPPQTGTEGKTEAKEGKETTSSSSTIKPEEDTKLRGPTSQQYKLMIALLDQKRRLTNAANRCYNWTVGWVPGTSPRSYQDKSVLPLNHAQLVDDLFHIHGHEVLVDGFFNADPHPGNLLLIRLPDGSPQLGLIDYGQVKTLTKEQRHLFARLVLALDNDDKEEIVALMKEAGYRSERMDPDTMYVYAKVGYDLDSKALTGGKHIQLFMEELQARDPIIQLPTDFIMVSRASLMLRGLAHALHQSRSTAKEWRPIAERVLREDI